MTGGVFISYRRDDSGGFAGRIYDRLSSRLGRENVFFDVDTIPPGRDFVDVLSERVGKCDALLAVIGKHWVLSARLREPPPPRRSPRLCPHRDRGCPQSKRPCDSGACRRRGDASSQRSAGQPGEADPSAGRGGFTRSLRVRCRAADPNPIATRGGDPPAGSQPIAFARGWARRGNHDPGRCGRVRSQPCSRAIGISRRRRGRAAGVHWPISALLACSWPARQCWSLRCRVCGRLKTRPTRAGPRPR